MTSPALTATTPTRPPVTLLLDAHDDRTIHAAAYQRAHPDRGRITTDPTPHTNSLAYLALDLLRAMGRDSFSHPDAERMSTDPAWRAVTCWTLNTGLEEAIVLRAHRLTPERLHRLATWRTETGIHLILLAHTPTPADEQRLNERLTAADLTDLTAVRGTDAILSAIGPAATGRRHGPPRPTTPIRCPACPAAALPPSAPTVGAAKTTSTSPTPTANTAPATPPPAPGWPATARHRHPRHALSRGRRPGRGHPWQDMEGLRLFLARLTVLSPSPQHTLARVRGAQAGFLSQALLLNVPDDLAEHGGPGITTVPITPRVAHTLTSELPNPLRAAAVAALLFTGTAQPLLSMTQLASIDERTTRLAIDRDSRINVGVPPGPRHMYAIPPRARPLLAAALEFRRRTPRTADHLGLFANCFGTSERFDHLIRDTSVHVPAVVHPHPADDWHTAARCWHLNTPALAPPGACP
ncbi:hypothetical protein O1M54_50715 [Streptomyces diastatochromogenes]|nr:hypothetical protein [Streptomyces diastatochromogenes]